MRLFNSSITYLFRVCDLSSPKNESGCVYVFVSQPHENFACVGTTSCVRTRLSIHNYEVSAPETTPACPNPNALCAWACGFGETKMDLRWCVERR